MMIMDCIIAEDVQDEDLVVFRLEVLLTDCDKTDTHGSLQKQ